MTRIKEDFSRVSLNQLCTLTGKTSRTLKRFLVDVKPVQEGGTLYYNPVEVLPVIFEPNEPPPYAQSEEGEEDGSQLKKLDPVQQRARLDKLKGDKVELEVAQLHGKLLPIARVEASWQQILGAFRSKILNLPAKLAPRVCATKDVREIQKILRAECEEALKELSEYGDGLTGSRAQPSRG